MAEPIAINDGLLLFGLLLLLHKEKDRNWGGVIKEIKKGEGSNRFSLILNLNFCSVGNQI